MQVNLFSIAFTFIEGILTFISPCILPMLPIYFLYLAGSKDECNGNKAMAKSRLVRNSIGFAAGFTIVFVALGATVTSLGYFLTSHREILQKISGIIMILFGLNFIGILKLSFLNMEKRIKYKFDKLNFSGSIIFGIVFGFGWTPCLGAFLGSALALAGNSKTLIEGMALLFVFSAGLGIPFIASAVVFEKIKGAFVQIQKYSRIISILSGVLLIGAGILVFTYSIKYLSF